MSANYTIELANEQTLAFKSEPLIESARMILADYQITAAEISIAVVDGSKMRELNNQYLQHDYDTDVLSFVLDFDPKASTLGGQLIVSTTTATEMAESYGTSLDGELLLYVIHGMLHLVGLTDKTEAGAAEMRAEERDYLERFGLPHVWSEKRQQHSEQTENAESDSTELPDDFPESRGEV